MGSVNIRIRQIGKATACGGIPLVQYSSKNPEPYLRTPKLRPGEVVAVPEGHFLLNRENAPMIELTTAAPTRVMTFDSTHAASVHLLGSPAKADKAVSGLEISLEQSAVERANREAEQAKLLTEEAAQAPVMSDAQAKEYQEFLAWKARKEQSQAQADPKSPGVTAAADFVAPVNPGNIQPLESAPNPDNAVPRSHTRQGN